MTVSVAAAKKDYALDKSDLDGLPRPLTVDTVRAAALAKYGSEIAYKNAAQVITLTHMPTVDLCIPRVITFFTSSASPTSSRCMSILTSGCVAFSVFSSVDSNALPTQIRRSGSVTLARMHRNKQRMRSEKRKWRT